ncbi:hypothetical protein GS454_01315 [Rhodococcus hoagii]|nr:hypothetical protein [Prescottella equi]
MVKTNKTAAAIANADPGILDDVLQAAIAAQPWYRKYSNELTTLYFALLQAISLVIGFGIELPGWAMIAVSGVIFVGNLFGLSKTANGITDATAEKLKADLTSYVGGK